MASSSSSSSSNVQLSRKFREICSDLNLDRATADEAYNSFQRIQINYTLEGEKIHWLACALYVACRKGTTPTIDGKGGYVEGNCVSLTRLLRSCKLSLIEFFSKMKKWSDMANLPHEMKERLDLLERNFHVSGVLFGKLGNIFKDLFKSPILSPSKQASNRSRKQRKLSLTSGHVFSFCWTLFVRVKAEFKMISHDLINSYHLLLACIDFCFSNVLVSENAKELLNSEFSELPPGFFQDEFIAPEPVPCILETLCNRWKDICKEDSCVEAKGIKEYWFKPCIKRMIDKKIFRCRNPTHFLGFLDNAYFEANLKAITKEYDHFVLNIGNFDERNFLSDNADEELGAPQGDFEVYLNNVQQRIKEAKSLTPQTPLSNRHYLANRENMGSFTPVTNAVRTVSRLQSLLLDCKPEPSPGLVEIFAQCTTNPNDRIVERIKELGDEFLKNYCQPAEDHGFSSPSSSTPYDPTKKMLNSGITLYFKCLEKIIGRELKKWSENEKKSNLTNSLSHELFHLSLFACCMEIVLFAYNSEKRFPWIVNILSDYHGFQPLHFYRVIELIIREEDGLSRDIVKHLNTIEEQILESAAWKTGSVLWEMIKANGSVPACQDVSLANPSHDSNTMSPAPATPRRLDGIFASPLPPSMSDRFISPMGNTRRRLFDNEQYIQVSIPAQTNTGEVRLIHVTLQPQSTTNLETNSTVPKSEPPKVNKAGSLGLFFRKVYHLAWLRLRDLCDKLNINDEDLRRKIWTCFEFSIRNHTDLMRDRHLDQILMCAVYAMCKVTGRDQSFQDIMKCYRQQPQASSHIYRNVLLTNRKRRNSTSCENSRNSESSSPNQEDNKERIRSSSTLPVPHPNSQPPTPTRLTGTGSNFDFPEERGDLIMFYNQIYIPEVKQYIMKFNAEAGSPPLSPLPKLAANSISPYRRISSKHSLFISPMKANLFPPSPRRPMSYHFLRSPAKDLKAINSMMKLNSSSGNEKKVIKRILQDDTNETNSDTRRHGAEKPVLRSMIDNIYTERQEDGDDTEDNGDVDME